MVATVHPYGIIIKTPNPENNKSGAIKYLNLPLGILIAHQRRTKFKNKEFPNPRITLKLKERGSPTSLSEIEHKRKITRPKNRINNFFFSNMFMLVIVSCIYYSLLKSISNSLINFIILPQLGVSPGNISLIVL